MSPWLVVRWPVDRAVAAVVGILALPCVAALAALIRFDDGPPAIVRLRRVGRHGVPFDLVKLRTMRADTCSGAADGPPLSGAGDPRVTRMGRWMRPHRLDELPQLANVVRGQMGLLGPRPEAPPFVDERDARWGGVLAARPGIAGPTQLLLHQWEEQALSGDDGPTIYESRILPVKLEIDRWYVRRASPTLDAIIVVALVQRFLARRSVTVLHGRVRRELPHVVDALEGRLR